MNGKQQKSPGAPKRWSCAAEIFGERGAPGRNASIIGPNAISGRLPSSGDDDAGPRLLRASEDQSLASLFDPNHRRYLCCCDQTHATTGLRIIAGMLSVTVLLEFWQLCWHFLSGNSGRSPLAQSPSSVTSSLVQLLFGLFIVSTVLLALWRESALLLLPYLLLQAVGLVAVFIIFLALFYVVLDNDLATIKAFVEMHGPVNTADTGQRELVYLGWALCLSCLALLAIQFWLISIVFACWRFFRDKHAFLGSPSYSSALLLLRPLNNAAGNNGEQLAEEGQK